MLHLQEKLRQKKLKITPQRLEILRALEKNPLQHPSADMLYHSVRKRYPAVSRATVYKTLDTLVEIGELKVALISDGTTRYDTRIEDHHHFLCSACGYVEDVDVHLSCLDKCGPGPRSSEHRITRSEVVFHGLCRACNEARGCVETNSQFCSEE